MTATKPASGCRRKWPGVTSAIFCPGSLRTPSTPTTTSTRTGQEILNALPGPVDAFVAGYGTGGTLAGVGRAVKQRYPKAKVIAMEPAEAALLCGEMPCCHSIEGVTGGFIPPLLRSAPLDDEIKVRSADALAMTRRLHRDFGLLVGTSSGANVFAAMAVASKFGQESRSRDHPLRPRRTLFQHPALRRRNLSVTGLAPGTRWSAYLPPIPFPPQFIQQPAVRRGKGIILQLFRVHPPEGSATQRLRLMLYHRQR